MKAAVLALAAAIVIGCANNKPVQFSGPNGRQAYSMSCSGRGGWGECYQQLGKLCPGGYDIIQTTSEPTAMAVNGQMMMGARSSIAAECR